MCPKLGYAFKERADDIGKNRNLLIRIYIGVSSGISASAIISVCSEIVTADVREMGQDSTVITRVVGAEPGGETGSRGGVRLEIGKSTGSITLSRRSSRNKLA